MRRVGTDGSPSRDASLRPPLATGPDQAQADLRSGSWGLRILPILICVEFQHSRRSQLNREALQEEWKYSAPKRMNSDKLELLEL